MSGMQNPYAKTIAQSSDCLGDATAQGLLFDYKGEYPCAVSSPRKEDTIVGELYRLHSPSDVFGDLDYYEDCVFEEPHHSLFVRCIVPVKLATDGSSHFAWMYFWNRSVEGMKQIFGGDFRNHCR